MVRKQPAEKKKVRSVRKTKTMAETIEENKEITKESLTKTRSGSK
jgi:hypothetical protein